MATTGKHRAGGARPRRGSIVAVVLVVLLLAAGIGYVLTSGGGGDQAAGSVTPRPSKSHPPKPTPSISPSPETPSPSATASATPSASPSTDPNALPPGRSFIYAKAADTTAPSLTVDLAYFYTGQDAIDQAAAHGDPPPENGYYIVNDSAKLRTVPVSPDVVVRYIPANHCCNLKAGSWDGFAAAVNGTAMTDYPDMASAPWWATVVDGQIVRIQQQYLP